MFKSCCKQIHSWVEAGHGTTDSVPTRTIGSRWYPTVDCCFALDGWTRKTVGCIHWSTWGLKKTKTKINKSNCPIFGFGCFHMFASLGCELNATTPNWLHISLGRLSLNLEPNAAHLVKLLTLHQVTFSSRLNVNLGRLSKEMTWHEYSGQRYRSHFGWFY